MLTKVGSADGSGAEAVTVDSQNRILVAGSDNTAASASAGVGSDIYVARYLPSGTLDSSFGSHGIADVHFGFDHASDARGIALQHDGKIVVVGLDKGLIDNTIGIGSINFAIARLNSNGSLDSSFNDGGTKTVNFSDGDAIANAVTLDYSGTSASNPHYGTIVVSGSVKDGDALRIAAIRIKPNGSLDASFQGNGMFELVPTKFTGGSSTGVVIQSSGDIVLSGTLGTYSNDEITNGNFALVRLTPAGNTDTSFGTGSAIVTLGFAGNDVGDSLLLGPSNRLIIGGSAGRLTAVISFTQNGLLDPNFGQGGKVTTDFGGATTSAVGMAYLGDRIVAVGGGQFDTARYIDTNPTITVEASIAAASEQGPTPATFTVYRSQALPYDTQVDFSIGGTATPPSLGSIKLHTEDYTLGGMTVPLAGLLGKIPPPYVDIPAGKTYVVVTLTPIDDSIPEPTETAIFSAVANTFYNIARPYVATISILDNDTKPKTLHASADAYVQDGSSAGTNFGTSVSLVVKNGTTGFNRVTYLKFDLSSVSTINSVQLQLSGNLSNNQNSSVGTSVFSVADTSWTQSGITFNNAPAAGTTALASATITGTTGAEYTFDLTAYVKAQKAAGHNIVSFATKDPLASNSAVIFNSSLAANGGPSLLIS